MRDKLFRLSYKRFAHKRLRTLKVHPISCTALPAVDFSAFELPLRINHRSFQSLRLTPYAEAAHEKRTKTRCALVVTVDDERLVKHPI